jgi:hypothetical protein
VTGGERTDDIKVSLDVGPDVDHDGDNAHKDVNNGGDICVDSAVLMCLGGNTDGLDGGFRGGCRRGGDPGLPGTG